MVREAEEFEDEDRKTRERVEARASLEAEGTSLDPIHKGGGQPRTDFVNKASFFGGQKEKPWLWPAMVWSRWRTTNAGPDSQAFLLLFCRKEG